MMRSENGISRRATADQEDAEPLFLHEAADRQQAKTIATAGAAGRDEVADVDTVGDEDGRHAAVAQVRGDVGVAGDDDSGAAAPARELCWIDFARVARVRGEPVRHAELAGRARRNLRRRVGEVAVHTGDVAAAQVRGDHRGLLASGPAGSITTRSASRETAGCGSAPSPGLVAKIAASAPAASSAASSPRANVSEIRGNPLTTIAMRRRRCLHLNPRSRTSSQAASITRASSWRPGSCGCRRHWCAYRKQCIAA